VVAREEDIEEASKSLKRFPRLRVGMDSILLPGYKQGCCPKGSSL
jgi:hypothetical protein